MKVTLFCFSLLVMYDEDSWTMFHILQYVSTVVVYSKLVFVLTDEVLGVSLPLLSQQYQSTCWVRRQNIKQGLKIKLHRSSQKSNPVILEILGPTGKRLV